MNTATFDTDIFPAEPLLDRAKRVGIDVAVVSVSLRELGGSSLDEKVRACQAVPETAVWDESVWGQSVWGSSTDQERLEHVLVVLSNGSFPMPEKRERRSDGQRRQLRDAMILCDHLRSVRDLLVSNDRRAFVTNGRRQEIEIGGTLPRRTRFCSCDSNRPGRGGKVDSGFDTPERDALSNRTDQRRRDRTTLSRVSPGDRAVSVLDNRAIQA